MSGNLGAIEREAGTVTRAAILDLQTRLRLMDETFSRIVRNATVVASHAALQDLDFASSGHTGFTSSVAFAAHTGAANHPYLDAIETWTAVQTFTPEAVFNGGIDLGTSGRFDSNVVDALSASNFLFQPTTAFTSGSDRWVARFNTSTGTPIVTMNSDGSVNFGAAGSANALINVTSGNTLTQTAGMIFNATFAAAGSTIGGIGSAVAGATFAPTISNTAGTSTSAFGGAFSVTSPAAGTPTNPAQVQFYGALVSASRPQMAHVTTNLGGILIRNLLHASAGTLTNCFGLKIEATSATMPAGALVHGISVDEQTTGSSSGKFGILLGQSNTGYKAAAFRDANAFINSDASGDLDLNASTNLDVNIGGTRYVNFNATTLDLGNVTSHSLRYTLSNNTVSFNGNAVMADVPSNSDSQPWTFTSNRSDSVAKPDAFTFRAAGANANITLHTDWLDTSSNSVMTLSKVGVLTLPLGNAVVVRDTGSYFASDNANEVDVHGQTAIDLNINGNQEIRITALSTAFRNGHDITFGTGAGTKIGTGTTQKLAFWNVAPTAQPATTGTTTGYTAVGGGNVQVSDTFTGNTGATAYTIGDIVNALKTCGIMAA